MHYRIEIKEIHVENDVLRLVVAAKFQIRSELSKVKLVLHFINGVEDRLIPLVVSKKSTVESGFFNLVSDYKYFLHNLFWQTQNTENDIVMYMDLLYEDNYEECIPVDMTPTVFEQDEKFYLCQVEGNALRFTWQSNGLQRFISYEKNRLQFAAIRKKIGQIYQWIIFVISLLFLPWIMLDGLLAVFGVIPFVGSKANGGLSKARRWIAHVNKKLSSISSHKLSVRKAKATFYKIKKDRKCNYLHKSFLRQEKKYSVVNNRISFVSVRRDDLSGNFEFVYNKIKKDPNLDLQMFLNTKDICDLTKTEVNQLTYLCATSKVVVLDEYTPHINSFKMRPETKVVQLWHACGAFKTFGFTRLGKPRGAGQKTITHRNYDYVTVSSKNVRRCYAEGFGLPVSHIIPTGIPRTDVFFDESYSMRVRDELYKLYPQMKNKKVILFAPTFRGNVREDSYYPMEEFNVGQFMEAIGEEYFLIIKHHPFVSEKHPVPEACRERVLDLSMQSELNDLLFVSDLIITDYSSLVFEASLLNIPMLFYTFDLKKYILERDFYFDFESFIPGRFFYTQEDMQEAINNRDFEEGKVNTFAKKFFDDFDGCSAERVAKLLYQALGES